LEKAWAPMLGWELDSALERVLETALALVLGLQWALAMDLPALSLHTECNPHICSFCRV